jgi:hypothetical protein
MVEIGWVHAASEYTSTLTAVIVPSRSIFWDTLIAARVDSVRKVAIMTVDTTASCMVLELAISFTQY